MKIGVIANPLSGHGKNGRVDWETCDELRAYGHDVIETTTHSYDASRKAATELIDSGIDALVVVGGDGMVHLGVDAVAQTGVPLGIVASGTGNDIARHFQLPVRDVKASTRVIDNALRGDGLVLDVDAIHTTRPNSGFVPDESEWSLAVVSGGLDAAINAHANTLKWPHGEARYLRAAFAELRQMKPYGYRITTDHGAWEGPALLLAVANTRFFGGGMDIAPMADPTDGQLDLLRLDPVSVPVITKLLSSIFSGGHMAHPKVHHERSRVVTVEAWTPPVGASRTGNEDTGVHPRNLRRPPLPYSDGEPLVELPLRFEAIPGAVQILLPTGNT